MQTAKVAQAYDTRAAEYDRHYSSLIDLAENDALATIIREQLLPYPVLDAGCGTGLLLDLVQIHSVDYFGLDISRLMLREASHKHPGYTFWQGDMSRPTGLGKLGSVVSLFAFQYCLHPLPALTNLVSTLRPGGKVLIVMSSRRHAHRASYIAKGNGLAVSGLSAYQLGWAANLAGLTDVRVRGFNVLGDWRAGRAAPPSREALARYLVTEYKTLGGIRPDLGWHLVMTGRRPDGR